ncbi:MAG: hypothetical protein HKM01_08395 [Gallionella sp.]|nr:hypothetical protein [Gallionella sp.]
MINLLLGPPGGGKSFEAVVFHVLPALRKGRKVITNLPLNMEELRKLDVKYPALVDLRVSNREEEIQKNSWNAFHRVWDKLSIKQSFVPFASLADYGDSWRHPKTGAGPLYVIDECHKPLPAKGTQKAVEEWFAEHRHEFADVLLITQSSGKLCKAITDSCQVVYRVKKATALGSNNAYIRKVQDGLRGEVVNEAIRRYKPEFFKFYKSHTRSDGEGSELAANDIVPFWKRWPVVGAGICFLLVVGLLLSGKTANPMKAGIRDVSLITSASAQSLSSLPVSGVPSVSGVVPVSAPGSSVPAVRIKQAHPFEGMTIHVTGFIENDKHFLYSFSADQNGQTSFSLSQKNLILSGYTVEKLSPCSALIGYKDIHFYAVCDTPQTGIARTMVGNGGA